ncbi:hypothetical protein MASR2M78_05280 [Treponema sp.]
MEERDILQHLLEVEAKASSLVSDAQAEADKRTTESEKEARASYDLVYSARVKDLEAEFQKSIQEARSDFTIQLDAYRTEISRSKTYPERFSTLVHKLLFGES